MIKHKKYFVGITVLTMKSCSKKSQLVYPAGLSIALIVYSKLYLINI